MENRKILVINPGSTSTKIGVFIQTNSVFQKNIKHSIADLKSFRKPIDQLDFREEVILKELLIHHIDLAEIGVVIGRGGLIKPVTSGVYLVNELMKQDLTSGHYGEHASNLGGLIADKTAQKLQGVKALIADPVVVDELQDVARITGHPLFERKSVFHALNQKAVARLYAQSIGRKYEDMNLIVAHLGGGITVGSHCMGKVIDVNQGLDGEGPMSPERSGTLPMGDLIKLCFNQKYDFPTIQKMITGEGGYVAYFGINDAHKIEIMADKGDARAKLVQEAMGYQVSKYIGASASVLEGKVDAILLTGGMAYNKTLTTQITRRVSFISNVLIFPGEDEMKALALNAWLYLTQQVEGKEYV
jgi:butyrate kinase